MESEAASLDACQSKHKTLSMQCLPICIRTRNWLYDAHECSSFHKTVRRKPNLHHLTCANILLFSPLCRFTCNTCGKRFVRKYNWLRHSREHEREKKFICETCNKKFHRAYYLTEHKRVHTGLLLRICLTLFLISKKNIFRRATLFVHNMRQNIGNKD